MARPVFLAVLIGIWRNLPAPYKIHVQLLETHDDIVLSWDAHRDVRRFAHLSLINYAVWEDEEEMKDYAEGSAVELVSRHFLVSAYQAHCAAPRSWRISPWLSWT